MNKKLFIWVMLLSMIMGAMAAQAQNLLVSGCTYNPSANGIYTPNGTYNGHTKWTNANGISLYKRGCWSAWVMDQGVGDWYCPDASTASTNDPPVNVSWGQGGDGGSWQSGTVTVVYAGMSVSGNATYIPNGDTTPATTDDTDFGSAGALAGTVSHTFTITNYNTTTLNLTGSYPYVSITGSNASDFTVTAVPGSTSLAQNASTTFTVEFAPSATGTRTATISIANDCAYESPAYTYAIQGLGTSTSTISGYAGVAGATMSYTDGTAKTATSDGSGNYSFAVSWDWSGTVTPSKAGYTFDPVSQSYMNVQADQTHQDYDATPTSSAPSATTYDATSVGATGATLNGMVNANNASTTVTFEYGTTVAYGSTVTANQSPVTGSTITAVDKAITGLTSGTTYHYRVVGVNASGTDYGADMTFTTGSAPPTAATNVASSLGSTGATLNGTVNANGLSTAVTFEYGLTDSYGSTVTATQSPVTGSTNTAVSSGLTGLTPNQLYHYRVKAVSAGGTTYGADMVFTTIAAPPVAVTQAASSVGTTSANLNGTVAASNASTTVTFEYGTDTNYGSTATAAESPLSGTAVTPVGAGLSSLTPNTTYHYRVKAVNTGGTANGLDMTFTTGEAAPTATTNAASAVGTDTATLNGTVNANNSSTTVIFEYGLDTNYGTTATATPSPVTGTANSAVSADLTGLTPNTTYHYRVAGSSTGGTTNGADMTFTTSTMAPTATTNAATAVGTTSATLNGTVNANNASTTVTFEYGTTDSYGSTATGTPSPVTGTSSTAVSAGLTSLVPNTTYHYRVVGSSSGGTTNGADMTFTTGATAPTATTNAATAVGTTSATLNGTVNANNASTTVTFEYGTTDSYGSTATGTPSPVTGTSSTAVSAGLTSLVPNTTYHYRVVGSSSGGTTNGADMTFTTGAVAPTVTTDAASSVVGGTATLNGTINANNSSTTVTFEYGTTVSYGSTVTADQSPVIGTSNTAVSKALSGLAFNTTYHYRVVGSSGGGTANGADMTFTTLGPEIAVTHNRSQNVIAIADTFRFGNRPRNSIIDTTFVIHNTGDANLTLTLPVTAEGDTSQFELLTQPAATVPPGDSTDMQVRFKPTELGDKFIAVSITNNDADESPFEWIITGTGTNNPPEIFGILADTLDWAEGDAAIRVSHHVEVWDKDGLPLQSARIWFTEGYQPAEDVLTVTAGQLSWQFDAATGVLTITGEGDFDAYEAALQSITYINSSADNPTPGLRKLFFTVDDGEITSNVVQKLVRVRCINDGPSKPELLSPVHMDTIYVSGSSIEALWCSCTDPEGDEVHYTISATALGATVSMSCGPDTCATIDTQSWPDGSIVLQWYVTADDGLTEVCSDTNTVTLIKSSTAVNDDSAVPTQFELHNAYPNPFNPETHIGYDVAKGEDISIAVYDIMGRKVCDLVNELVPAGCHEIIWRGTDDCGRPVASGLYLIRFSSSSLTKTRKIMFLK